MKKRVLAGTTEATMRKAGRPEEGSKRKVTIYVPEEDAVAFERAAEEAGLPRPGPLYVAAVRTQARRYRRDLDARPAPA